MKLKFKTLSVHIPLFIVLLTAFLGLGLNLSELRAEIKPGKKGGTLIVGTVGNVPRHLNPAVQSGIATAMPGTQIFATPLRFDENWNPEPYLAESWDFSSDKKALRLRLRKNARFHDGKPITSKDIKFSIEVIKANHPFKSMFEPVIAIETPDPYTAIIRLSKRHPAILLALSSALCVIIPQHIYGDGQDLKTHPANVKPVGSGPFKLVEFIPSQHVILERNEDFFIENRPYLDEIIFKVIPDANSLVLEMQNDSIDLSPFLDNSVNIDRLKKLDHLEVTRQGYEAVGPINWLAFNLKHEILGKKEVRQAIAYAVDRDFITKILHKGNSLAQRSPIIESSPYFNSNVNAYNLDLKKAEQLLDAAGYKRKGGKEGIRFELNVDYLPGLPEQQKSIAEYLKSQLKKVGINIIVRASPDFPSWAKRISNYEFDMTMDVVFNWGDPVIGVHRTFLSSNIKKGVIWSNTQNYKNKKVDSLLNEASSASGESRKKLYDEFQEIVAEELPIYWINSLPYHTVYSKRLGNAPLTIWGTMAPLDELYWENPR